MPVLKNNLYKGLEEEERTTSEKPSGRRSSVTGLQKVRE
jgi:hypothetical protein